MESANSGVSRAPVAILEFLGYRANWAYLAFRVNWAYPAFRANWVYPVCQANWACPASQANWACPVFRTTRELLGSPAFERPQNSLR
jgi:hypothetical protein